MDVVTLSMGEPVNKMYPVVILYFQYSIRCRFICNEEVTEGEGVVVVVIIIINIQQVFSTRNQNSMTSSCVSVRKRHCGG